MDELRKKVIQFNEEREWGKFHTPRNLAISMSLEAAEVLEKSQWKLDDTVSEEEMTGLKEEMADVLLYLIQLSEVLKIDVMAEAHRKIEKNAQKYPVDKAKGSSTKYNKL